MNGFTSRSRLSDYLSDHLCDATGGHQQYLDKNPFGYRCHSATGIPIPTA